jgi:hypothetical protein
MEPFEPRSLIPHLAVFHCLRQKKLFNRDTGELVVLTGDNPRLRERGDLCELVTTLPSGLGHGDGPQEEVDPAHAVLKVYKSHFGRDAIIANIATGESIGALDMKAVQVHAMNFNLHIKAGSDARLP